MRMTQNWCAAALVALCGTVHAQETQTNPLPQFDAPVEIDSGAIANTGSAVEAVFSEIVWVEGADWLRLRFDEITLAGSKDTGNGSFLRLTSLEDGAVQFLDQTSVEQWRYTSAYFNGDTVLVELMAYPGTGTNELSMSSVIAGEPYTDLNQPESICGSTDDRTLSSDPRAARALPIGCTAWMIDDCEHCFLTAGHCNGGGNSDINVVQFQVPLSDNSCAFGGINHPGPEDQYPVDAASQQTNGGQGTGNDWGYFGVFPNSNTGLLPWQAQGDWYTFDPTVASGSTSTRVTGYGSVSSSLAPCSWYLVQKTHAGPFVALTGNLLQYAMDTTGGNSGSPVIDDATGAAFGIHTHAGCSTSGGANQGTWGDHPGLQAALADPQGVCIPSGPNFAFPGGLPGVIPPTGIAISITIDTGNAINPVPATARVDYEVGGGSNTIPLTHNGGTDFSVFVPGGDCNEIASMTFRVDGDDAMTYSSQEASAVIADEFLAVANLDMETDAGWTTSSSGASTGQWDRGVPGDYGRSDPSADADGSGSAWVTGNTLNEDVDGGTVTLLTDVYDATAIGEAELSYAVWHQTNDPGVDVLRVEVSNNAGATWSLVESITGTSGWETHSFLVSSVVSPTTQVQLRFISNDTGSASITESGVDDFSIGAFVCDDACLADTNGDGELTPGDFSAWVQAFNAGAAECDQNGDGSCTPQDFGAWVQNYNAGC